MSYTYEKTERGFKIFKDGAVVINQYHYPEKAPDLAISEADKDTLAQSFISDLESKDAIVRKEEKYRPF